MSTPPKTLRIAALFATLACSASTIAAPAPALRAITDVWGGTSNGNIAQGCTTFAPIADLSTFFGAGGFRAEGGNTACGFTGVTADQTAAGGSLLAQQSLLPLPLDNAGSTYAGGAAARAAYGSLGVAAQSLLVGAGGATGASVSTGAAFFQDSFLAASGSVATGNPGFVRYVFSLDGALSTSATQAGSASVQLDIRHAGGPVLDLARLSSQGGDAGHFAAIDSDASSWVLGAGSLAGAGLFGSTLHVPFFGDVDLPIVWGSSWDVTVGLLALTGRTADASFMSSAKLVDIQLFDSAHQRINDFSLGTASGTDYYSGAAAPVPEPSVNALTAIGLLAVMWCVGRRRTTA